MMMILVVVMMTTGVMDNLHVNQTCSPHVLSKCKLVHLSQCIPSDIEGIDIALTLDNPSWLVSSRGLLHNSCFAHRHCHTPCQTDPYVHTNLLSWLPRSCFDCTCSNLLADTPQRHIHMLYLSCSSQPDLPTLLHEDNNINF